MMTRALFLLAVAVSTSSAFSASSYTITEIQSQGSPFVSGVAITDSNLILTGTEVASNSDPTPTFPSAAIWNSSGYLQPLSDLPNGQAGVAAMNSSGVVVGRSYDLDSGEASAVEWQNGQPSVLPPLGTDGAAIASGINDSGAIVGISLTSAFGQSATRAVLWNGGIAQDVSTKLPNNYTLSRGVAINNSGQILINANTDSQAHTDSYLMSGTSVQKITTDTADSNIIGNTLNNHGEVAGTIYTGPGQGQAFEWSNGTMVIAPSFSNIYPFEDAPTAINNDGTVVGFYISSTGESAFIWDGSNGIVDLNGLIDPNSGWVLSIAWGINDNGDIVGTGYHDGERQGFLLTPNAEGSNTSTPEPATASVLFLGTTLLFRRNRRRV